MGDRIVKVSVTASVNSYLAGMDQVAKKAREGRSEAEQLTAKLEAQRKAFDITGKAMLVAGGVIAAGLVLATKRAADFDQAMSEVQAATHASEGAARAYRAAAIEAGESTVFTASEAARAIEELAKADVSREQILGGGLKGTLDLAASSAMNLTDAAKITSTTLKQFGLDGDKASHVADLLAAGAGKSVGEVSDLGMALSQSGGTAAKFGISVEETTGTLAAFAAGSLLGSDAGTSFRAMLLRLANPTGEAAAKMEELGIQAYDAQGNFVGMAGLAGQLQQGLKGLTQEQRNAALAIIFGQDAIRSASILYDEGASGIAEWTSKVDDAGYAAETAEKRLDNLNGDLEKLGGAFDTALIGVGASGQGPLRVAVQGITELIDGFNDMPEGGQAAVFWVGAVGAAVLLAGGAFLVAVPKIAAFKVAWADLGISAGSLKSRLSSIVSFFGGPYGIAAAAATVATIAFNKAIEDGVPSQAQLTNAAQSTASAMEMLEAATKRGNFEQNLWGDYADQLENLPALLDKATNAGWRWAELSFNEQGALDSVKRLGDAFGEMAQTNLPAAQQAFSKIVTEFDLTDKQAAQLLNEMPALRDVLLEQATAAGQVATDHDLLDAALGRNQGTVESSADAYQRQAEQVNGVRDALVGLMDQFNAMNSIEQQAIQANEQWITGLADVTIEAQRQRDEYEQLNGTLDGFALSLDTSTAAGATNAAMLAGLAGDAQAAATAQFEVDQKTKGADEASRIYAGTLAAQRQAFIDSAIQAGYNAGEVQALADKVFALPTEKEIEILADTASATTALDSWMYANDGRRLAIFADVKQGTSNVGPLLGGYGFASGGIIPGAPSNSDNMIAAVASGEFVVRASQVQHPENRRVLEYINSGGRMRGYATGGLVSDYPHAPTFAANGFVQPVYAASTAGATATGTFGGVTELGPKSLRALTRSVVNQISIDQAAISSASNSGNANQAWRRG